MDKKQCASIEYAHKVLCNYWWARELANQKKQSRLLHDERMTSDKVKEASIKLKDIKVTPESYHRLITDTLESIIKPQSIVWYDLLHKRYIERQKPFDIQIKNAVSHTYYNKHLNEALLHFAHSINI